MTGVCAEDKACEAVLESEREKSLKVKRSFHLRIPDDLRKGGDGPHRVLEPKL